MQRYTALGLAGLLAVASLSAHGEDAGRALGGLLQNLLRPPVQNSASGATENTLGGILGIRGVECLRKFWS